MRRATGLILQRHQMMHLPRQMTLMSDVRHIWNVIYNARSNRCHTPRSPNAAPATKNDLHHWSSWHLKCHLQCAEQQDSSSNVTKYCACHEKWLVSLILVTYETSFTMRGATGITLQPHQILRLPRKSALQNLSEILRERLKRQFQCAADSTMIRPWSVRAWSEHDPTMKLQNWTRPFAELTFPPRQRILYWKLQHFALRLSTQISPNTAPATKSDTPRSPNTAPATQNDSHAWSSSHMERHLQCAEEQASPANLTKYCACHAKWLSCLIFVTYGTSFTMRGATGITLQPHQILRLPRKTALQNLSEILRERLKRQFQCAAHSTMIRPWSEHDPTMNSSSRTRLFAEVTFCSSETHFVLKITTFRAPAIYPNFTKYCACHENWHSKITKYCACHAKWLSWLMSVTHDTSFTMRGATDLSLQHHQMLRLPRKMTRIIYPRDIWNVIYNARRNRHHPPTSPNTAPATQNDSHHLSSWYMKRYLQCAEEQASPANLTKYCACHAKWLSWLIFVTYETLFTMRKATGITLQPHQILRLPRKSTLQNQRKICRKQLKRQFQCGADSNMIRPWSEHELVISHPPVRRGYFLRFGDAFCMENYNISRSGYLPRFHRILRLPQKMTLQDHQILRLPRKVPLQDHEILRLPRKVTLQDHQILRLPRKVTLICESSELLLNCYWTELLLSCYWTVTELLLSCYWTVTELLLSCYWTVTELLLSCYWAVTELLLSCYWTVTELLLNCYWTVTELLLNCYWTVTELLLSCYWTITELLLSCYWAVTELLLNCYWAVTELLLNCYWTVTELLLNCYWTVTELLLSCYWAVTELLLNWAATELLLNCYWTVTELLLNCYWAVTELLLSCYWAVTELLLNWAVTELLLNCYWTVTELNCYWTELLLHF